MFSHNQRGVQKIESDCVYQCEIKVFFLKGGGALITVALITHHTQTLTSHNGIPWINHVFYSVTTCYSQTPHIHHNEIKLYH